MAWRSTRASTVNWSSSGTRHRHAGRTLHIAGVEEFDGLLVDGVPRVPGEELLERDARLEPGDRGAEAHVRAVTEGEDARVGARDVEVVRAIELARVTVARPEQEQHLRSWRHLHAVQRDRAGGGASHV